MRSIGSRSVALAIVLLTVVAGGSLRPLQSKETAMPPMGGSEAEAIRRTGIQMLEAWYGGDTAKLEKVAHPDLAKRGVLVQPGSGRVVLRHMDRPSFLAATGEKVGVIPADQWQIEAEILDWSENTAMVKVTSRYLVDICQLARLDGEWRIVNVLWYPRGTPPWAKRPMESEAGH